MEKQQSFFFFFFALFTPYNSRETIINEKNNTELINANLKSLEKMRMYNRSNRKQKTIQKRKYNYLQDLCGNSDITTTGLQRRNKKLYKNFNRIKNA